LNLDIRVCLINGEGGSISQAREASGSGHIFLGKRGDLLALDARLTSLDPEAKKHLLPLLRRPLDQRREGLILYLHKKLLHGYVKQTKNLASVPTFQDRSCTMQF